MLKYDLPHRVGGTMIHSAYQYLYTSQMAEKPEWFHRTSLAEKLDEHAQSLHPSLRDKLIEMTYENLVAFQAWLEEVGDHPTVFLEHEYKARVGDIDPGGPWPEVDDELVTARSDRTYRTESGLWIMDYKSVGRSGCNRNGLLKTWDPRGKYALNWQSFINLLVSRAAGFDTRGFVILRTTRQAPYDFDRKPLTIPSAPYKAAARVVRECVKHEHTLIKKLDEGGSPSPRFHACHNEYGACDYLDICLAETEADQHRVVAENFKQAPQDVIQRVRKSLRVIQ